MRVLLIEDDVAKAQSIKPVLKNEGFNVYRTDLGKEGVDLARLYDYGIILFDLNMLERSGFQVLVSLFTTKLKMPVLIVSGLAEIGGKVKNLGFGAADYMIKPIDKDELVARIHAIVRRFNGHAPLVIGTGDLTVNLNRKTVEVAGVHVDLTKKEYEVLELLSKRKGTALTRENLLNHLYRGGVKPGSKIIDVFICNLRKKIANASNGKNYIETVWDQGYFLRKPHDDEAKITACITKSTALDLREKGNAL